MLLFLKIIYKSFYKTRDRRESTKNAFIGLVTLYLTWTLIIILLNIMECFFPIFRPSYIMDLLCISVIAILAFLKCSKYVKKQLKTEDFYNDIKLSLLSCRVIFISIIIIGVAYIPGTALIWNIMAGVYK